jgi:hypothetical protein
MNRAIAVRAAAPLLGAGCVVWATVPLVHTRLVILALILAIGGVTGGALRLALDGVPVPEDTLLLSASLRAWFRFLEIFRWVPWEEGVVVAVVWLEVLHPSRPWPTVFNWPGPPATAILGAALIAYLLATHLAETDASPGTLRPQAWVLAAGAGLLALGAGAAMLPAVGPGAGAALLRVVAAGALIAAAALVLPYVAPRG